jgi:hypothetical protein
MKWTLGSVKKGTLGSVKKWTPGISKKGTLGSVKKWNEPLVL